MADFFKAFLLPTCRKQDFMRLRCIVHTLKAQNDPYNRFETDKDYQQAILAVLK
jgi:hypothetical protein